MIDIGIPEQMDRADTGSREMYVEDWQSMLRELGAPPEDACFRKLCAAYAESHRAYHTTRHVDDCLALLTGYRALAANAAEVACALWFHDAIYEPMRSGNEERSAEWAADFLTASGVAAAAVERIRAHILATRHAELPIDGDSRLVVDIDLAILGAEPARYEEFEREVRREYRWVPGPLFRRKRAEILESFLARSEIYFHAPIRERFERQARANMGGAIAVLRGAA